MKRHFLFLILTCSFIASRASVLIVEGKFQNKNIFILNGFGIAGIGFCVKEVKVNGQVTNDETNSSSFEIDLRSLQLKLGDAVTIEILHSEGCVPKVLNMEDLKPRPYFEVVMIDLSPSGTLRWIAKNERNALPYIVEQFKWNKWVQVGVVDGIGTSEPHEYSFKVVLHSGQNKCRFKQKGYNTFVKVSKDVTVVSSVIRPSFAIPTNNSTIDFSDETEFEIYDAYGNLVKKGFGKQVPIEKLDGGLYFLCYDNNLVEFTK